MIATIGPAAIRLVPPVMIPVIAVTAAMIAPVNPPTLPARMDSLLTEKKYQEIYQDLNSASEKDSKVFVMDLGANGLRFKQEKNELDTADVSYKSSAIAAIDQWKSPVLLVHGDDDRNVAFSQTVGLVQLLRARNIYHELIVIPDDTHETLVHSRWMDIFGRMETFLNRFVKEKR